MNITAQTIGGQKVWVPNPDNLSGTITIAGVTGDVNIVAAGAAVPVEHYATINVYCDDDRIVLTNSKGTQYKYMSKTEPTQVRLYGDASEYGCTLSCNENLAGEMVLVQGYPTPQQGSATTAVLQCVFTPSNYLSVDNIEFNDYSDSRGNGFMDGESYYIMVLPTVPSAGDVVIRGLFSGQYVYAFNGKSTPTLLTSGDGERFTLPADCVAIQIEPSDRGQAAEIVGIGIYEGDEDGLVCPAAKIPDYGCELTYIG